MSSGTWNMPVGRGRISAEYRQPGGWAAGFHTGVDFAVPSGTPVDCVGPGTVVTAGDQGAYGNAVIVRMDDGRFTLYAHLSSLAVKPGQAVSAGERLGLSGVTGNVTGPHLHFEARTRNEYNGHTDPLAYLASHGVAKAGAKKPAAARKKASSPAATASSAASFHTVRPGDTLSAIAQSKLGNADRHGEIAKLNKIENPNLIAVGQKLKLPAK
ncbi:peptidoglycan DD-metalloendopeptidase family protein [Streptomyces sp. NPDC091272]|uniref:peptidoglycan DD-metalloendopeptidase family protein n=1 Tax=Streptomyces sp. NPDC091272 TaxID=3365981 RepID=UPI00381604D2